MRAFVAFLLAFALAGCAEDGHDQEHEGHDDDHGAHLHVAPHDGLLVELGDHAANVELVLDAETGTLTAYLLGPHASEPVRSDAASLDVSVRVGGEEVALKLLPVADALSGERVGDTSTFRARHDALAGAEKLAGRLGALRLRGQDFKAVDFTWSAD